MKAKIVISIWLGFKISKLIKKYKIAKEDERKNREALERLRLRTQLKFMDFEVIKNLNGFDFEDYVHRQLNFLNIKNTPTKKSGDFGIDMFISLEQEYGVQLKHYLKSKVGVSAVQETFAGATYYNKVPVILTTGYFTKQAINLAQSLNIELINRDDIENWHNPHYKREYDHIEDGLYRQIQKSLILKMNC